MSCTLARHKAVGHLPGRADWGPRRRAPPSHIPKMPSAGHCGQPQPLPHPTMSGPPLREAGRGALPGTPEARVLGSSG